MNRDAAIFQEVDQRWPRFLLQRIADGFVKCATGWTGFFLLCQPGMEFLQQWLCIPPSPLCDFFRRAVAYLTFQPEQMTGTQMFSWAVLLRDAAHIVRLRGCKRESAKMSYVSHIKHFPLHERIISD